MNKSSITFVALIALVAGFSLSWYWQGNQTIELENGLWFGEQARPLPDFELIDHNNQPLTPSRFEGKWNLVFFGYTHCPDICPVTMQTMKEMMAEIDDVDIKKVLQVYFVSVDPDRDNSELLADYATYFNPAFIGASAPMEQLTLLTRSLGIAHKLHKKSDTDTDYLVDHSGAVVLVNPEIQYAGLFSAPHNAQQMARDITRIVEHN